MRQILAMLAILATLPQIPSKTACSQAISRLQPWQPWQSCPPRQRQRSTPRFARDWFAAGKIPISRSCGIGIAASLPQLLWAVRERLPGELIAGLGANGPQAVGGELGLDDADHGLFPGALSRRGSLCNFENSARAGKHSAPGETIAGLGGHWLSGEARGYGWEDFGLRI